MFIEFDPETCEWLTIYNRKPEDRIKHVLEADPKELDAIREQEYADMAAKEEAKQAYTNAQMDQDEDFKNT